MLSCRRGNDTVLGESSDPLQIFMVDDCQDTQLTFAVDKAKVGVILKNDFNVEGMSIVVVTVPVMPVTIWKKI